MIKLVKHLEALFELLKKGERGNRSLTAIALARALRHAEVLGDVEWELKGTFVEGDLFHAWLYKVRLRYRFGVLVHYMLYDMPKPNGHGHVEQGLAFFDSWNAHLELLHYEGRHAGHEQFPSKFPNYEAKLREFLGGGPFGYAEKAYPMEVAKDPRDEALDKLQDQAQELELDYY